MTLIVPGVTDPPDRLAITTVTVFVAETKPWAMSPAGKVAGTPRLTACPATAPVTVMVRDAEVPLAIALVNANDAVADHPATTACPPFTETGPGNVVTGIVAGG